jgi:soluble lytic murein transglycosylase-like protein
VVELILALALVPTPSPTISPLPSPIVQWYALKGAAESRLDPALVRAVIDAESDGDPNAVSSAGAVGLMQLEPATAFDCGIHDRFDPIQNVECGSRTLALLVRRYGIQGALEAYNFGEGNVASVHGDLSRMPEETQDYVWKVTLWYGALRHFALRAEPPPFDPLPYARFLENLNEATAPLPLGDDLSQSACTRRALRLTVD